MRDMKKYYLKMLRLEIDDLKDDIDLLIDEYTRLHDRDCLSNYVFFENLIVMRKELLGVDAFCSVMSEIDPDEFESLDDLIRCLNNRFRAMVKESGLPEVIELYVERKLIKVRDYIERDRGKSVI